MKINLRRLEIFSAVYRNKSVTSAAHELSLTQPTVTRMVKDFELDLGFKLFQLEKGKLRATPEADILYEESRGIFQRKEKLSQLVSSMHCGEQTHLKIDCAPYLSYQIMPQAVQAFSKKFPQVELILGVKRLQDQTQALLRQEIDLSLAHVSEQTPGVDCHNIGQGQFVCLVPKQHPLAEQQQISQQQLIESMSFLPQAGTPLVSAAGETLQLSELQEKRIQFNSSVLAAQYSLLKGDVILIDAFTAKFCQSDALIKPFYTTTSFDIHTQYLSSRSLNHFEQQFLVCVKQALAQFDEQFDSIFA